MSTSLIRRIGRVVTDPAHIITEFDSIETAVRVPLLHPDERFAGKRLRTSTQATNVAGAIGLPASVFLNAGLEVCEYWLAQVSADRCRIVHWIGRVFGAQSLWPEDRPTT